MNTNGQDPPNDIIEFGLTDKDFLKWKDDNCYKNIINNDNCILQKDSPSGNDQ